MEFKDFLKLRYMFLKQQKEVEDNLPNQIRISAKIHEIGLILDFLENKNIENIYKIILLFKEINMGKSK